LGLKTTRFLFKPLLCRGYNDVEIAGAKREKIDFLVLVMQAKRY
jgi:hypothetical protein